jgi:hypothetical protein
MRCGEEIGIGCKEIIIGRVINVTGMVGVSAGTACSLSQLYSSYFGVALASIVQTSFSGPGSCRNDRSVHLRATK